MIGNRIVVAATLITILITLAITRAAKTTLIICALCVSHDIYSCWNSRLQTKLVLILTAILCLVGNSALYIVYHREPDEVLVLITMSQISDILQYIFGRTFGRHHVSKISPNKTLEGYLGGFLSLHLLTYLFSLYFISIPLINNLWDISLIYILGALGGVIFSAVKRYLNRKDFSNMLGTHGGWLDRTDSLYLPALYLLYKTI